MTWPTDEAVERACVAYLNAHGLLTDPDDFLRAAFRAALIAAGEPPNPWRDALIELIEAKAARVDCEPTLGRYGPVTTVDRQRHFDAVRRELVAWAAIRKLVENRDD